MTQSRAWVILVSAALLTATVYYFRPHSTATRESDHSPSQPLAVSSSLAPTNAFAPLAPANAPERSELADKLNTPAQDIHADLQVLAMVFDAFRSNFPQRGNPIGTNAEITAVLTGKNPLQLALIPRDHPAINAKGELCDRWGHPFFFHQLSATQMEIRSAGPDQKFWTADDVVLTP
jgi:hypothetical protein